MKLFRKIGLLSFVILAFAVSGYGQRFSAGLDQVQEVPPSGSGGTGYGQVTVNPDQTSITVNLGFTGLGTAATAGHIHQGAVGVNGPVIFNLSPPPSTSGVITQQTFTITPAQLADLQAGNWYFNIHTGGFPGGEIRGQIMPPSCTSGSNVEVHATAGTLGPIGYTTLSAAVAAINAGTHQGMIDTEVCANVTETAAMFLNSGNAIPASYTAVNIYPLADGLTISGLTVAGRGVIELNGADNVTIDGDNPLTAGINRNLTITNTAASTTSLTSLIRVATAATTVTSADNITIRNLNLNGSATDRNISSATSTTASENNTFGIYAGGNASGAITVPTALSSVTTNPAVAGTTINNLQISNNAVNACARGVVFNGAASSVSNGVTISNNLIGDQSALAGIPPHTTPATTVYTKGIIISGTNALTVSGNSVRNILSYVGTAMNAIELVSAIGSGNLNINDNTVTGVVNNSGASTSSVFGILVSSAGGPFTIKGNTVSNVQLVSTSFGPKPRGIEVSTSAASATIERNRVSTIYNRSTGTGGVYGINLVSGNNITVQNNFVWDINQNMTGGSAFSTTFGVFGIRAAGTGHKIYNNSVNLYGTLFGTPNSGHLTAAFTIIGTGQTGIDVRNNIFSNTLTGGTTNIAHVSVNLPASGTSAMNLTINNNDNFSGTTAGAQGIAFVGGTYSATAAGTPTFAGLYTAANFNPADTATVGNLRHYTNTLSSAGTNDNAGIVTDPIFVSSTDLHLTAGSPTRDVGTVIGAVTNDIDGQIRPGGNALYDIGADEFDGVTPPANELQATAFIDPANGGTKITNLAFSPQASFTNNGTANQTYVTVRYRICTDAACTTEIYNQTAVIGSIASLATVTVTFPSTSIAVAGNYFIRARAELVGDTVTANDEISGTLNVVEPLSGTVTVGTGGAYPTITAAVSALNNLGVSGATTLSLLDNSYPSETFPITINQFPGVSSTNTITIKPAASVAPNISGSSSNCIFSLNGADWVTIDGSNTVGGTTRDMTITNTNTGISSAVVCIQSLGVGLGATNNTVKNTNLTGTTLTATNGTLFGVFSGGTSISISSNGADNDTNTIQNNNITKTQYGIYSGGESAANKNTGTLITQNVMNAVSPNNINTGGIYVRFENAVQISQNDISVLRHDGTAGQTGTAFGIALGVVPNATLTIFSGSDVTGASITKNKINGVTQLNSTGYSGFGIVVNSVTSGTTLLANNMISVVRAASTSPNDFSAGILAGGGTGSTTQIYYNSVSMTGTRGAATFPSYGLAIGGGDPIVNVRNNIFYNIQSSAGAGKMYAIGTGGTTFANLISDYNDLYVSGANAFVGQTGGLGTAGTDRATLANWQTATGKDANSISDDPLFVSTTDLHLQTTSTLYGRGTTVTGVIVDYDNDTRETPPDIGADEAFNGVLALGAAADSVIENVVGGTITITVNRTGGTVGAVSVPYTLADGTATGGAACGTGVDYVNTGGTVNFANGVSSQTFTVQICNESLFEGNETFTVNLGTAIGASVGTPTSEVVTITNDDTAPTLSINSIAVNEDSGSAIFTVTQSAVSGLATSFTFSTADGTATVAGNDYTSATNVPGSIAAGSTTTTVTVTITTDSTTEPDETFTVTLGNAINATITGGAGSGTILNDEIGSTGTIPGGTYTNLNTGATSTLGGNVLVTGTLTLGGILNANGSTITIDCVATVSGAGASNFVVGNVAKNYCATGAFTYPVGDNTGTAEYSPLTATVTTLNTNPSTLTVSVTDAFLPDSGMSQSASRYWNITETGDLIATLAMTYVNADINGTESGYDVLRRSGVSTEVYPGTSGNMGTQSVDPVTNTGTATNVQNFSQWAVGNLAPLAAGVNIGGRVVTADGQGIPRARMTVTDSSGTTRTTQTNAFGYYNFEDVESGQTVIVSVSHKQYLFDQPSQAINISENVTNADFISSGANVGGLPQPR